MPKLDAYLALAIVIVVAAIAFFAGRTHLTASDIPLAQTNIEKVAISRTGSPQSTSTLHQSPQSVGVSIVQIARSANLTLVVNDVMRTTQQIERLARERNGDVLNSALQYASGGDASGASYNTRVPSERFSDFLDALAALGNVKERTVAAEDKTSQIVDGTARLRNLRNTEADIRKIMDRSGSVSEVLEAENQLSSVREQIETLQAELDSAKAHVRFSTVSITLIAATPTRTSVPGASDQLADTFHTATQALAQVVTSLVALAIWIIVFSPLIAAAVATAWFTRRWHLRRQAASVN